MSLIQRAQRSSFRNYRSAASPGPLDDFWYRPVGYGNSGTGYISPQAMLTLSAIWQGTRLIGEGLGGMPCQLFRQRDDAGRDRLRGPGLPNLLRWQPNSWQTAFEFWQAVAIARLLRGLYIAKIKPGPVTGYADALIPIHPDLVTSYRLPDSTVSYSVLNPKSGTKDTLLQDEVFVVRGFTEPDGITPMSVIQYGARSIGATLSAQSMSAQFFKTGVTPSLAVIADDELGPEGIDNLHKSVMAYVTDRTNQFGVLPLENGVKLEKLGLTPNDAQLVSMLDFGVEDVARWLNIPLHMLRYSKQGTSSYASLEVFSAEFVTYTLRPHALAIEESIQRDLILEADKGEVVAEFNMDALLRGDLKSRYEAYRIGIMSGFLRRNEARIKENLDPAEGLDEFWSPMNMTSVDNSVGGDKGARAAKVLQFNAAMRAGREGYRMVVLARELAGRLVKKEIDRVERFGREHAKDGEAWQREVKRFYADFANEIADSLHISRDAAREYVSEHGLELQARGVQACESWEQTGTEQLSILALTGGEQSAAA